MTLFLEASFFGPAFKDPKRVRPEENVIKGLESTEKEVIGSSGEWYIPKIERAYCK